MRLGWLSGGQGEAQGKLRGKVELGLVCGRLRVGHEVGCFHILCVVWVLEPESPLLALA